MLNKQRRQQPPLKTAIQFFLLTPIFLIAAVVIPSVSVNCSSDGYVCIRTTYYGMDAHTFGIVLAICAVLCLVGGVVKLNQHKQTLVAQRNSTAYPPAQPFSSQQQGVHSPVQHTSSSGGYTDNVSSQQPWNTMPRQ